MDNEKLNELCATHGMGWHKEGHQLNGPYWAGKGGLIEQSKWNPVMNLNQAITVIEKVAGPCVYSLWRTAPGKFAVTLTNPDGDQRKFPRSQEQDTAALAFCICALRASGLTDEEIGVSHG